MMKKLNLNSVLKLFLGIILFMTIKQAISMESFNKYWSVATIIGSFSNKPSLKYYYEPQLRLIDKTSVFNQLFFLSGVGYQINTELVLFIGPGWILTNTLQNHLINENRLWEQLNWRIKNSPKLNINSRTRLEERKIRTNSAVAIRFRERVWFKVPIKNWNGYSLSYFDEIFLNFNHPQWVSPYLVEQNRAFIGVATQLSKSVILDVGYLNQYIHSFKNELNNVLLLNFTVTL